MKVLLVTEGTYPLAKGGVSTWCDHLIRSLPDVEFQVLALGPTGAEAPVWPEPTNVGRAYLHGMWGQGPSSLRVTKARRYIRRLDRALYLLWQSVIGPDTEEAVQLARTALRRIVELSDEFDVAATLRSHGSARALASAWADQVDHWGRPPLTVAQATQAATVVDHTLELAALRPDPTEVVHATANGPCGLIALAASWRHGSRIVLTEHGVYLREQYIALRRGQLDWVTRKLLTGFTRRLCEVVLREATAILPVSDFNKNWERRLGADPTRVRTIRNGVDIDQYAVVHTEPDVPTISFVGRIDPLKDLETLIRAHAIVLRSVPGTRLRLFGPVPELNHGYRRRLGELIDELGTGSLVSFEGPVDGSRPAIVAGHVVALSSISEGLPYTLIESMMCGRATVSTDVGGVAELTGLDGKLGIVVPPRRPEAFAEACVALLCDHPRRHAMGAAAAETARRRFSLAGFSVAYREAYDDAFNDTPTHEMAPISGQVWVPVALSFGADDTPTAPRRPAASEADRASAPIDRTAPPIRASAMAERRGRALAPPPPFATSTLATHRAADQVVVPPASQRVHAGAESR